MEKVLDYMVSTAPLAEMILVNSWVAVRRIQVFSGRGFFHMLFNQIFLIFDRQEFAISALDNQLRVSQDIMVG